MDRTVSYAGFPCSTQRSNNPTRSGGHAPSHGMEPFFRRSAIASAWVWTSAQDHRSNALRIELRSFSRNRGLISASKLISGAGIFTTFRPGGAAIDGAAVELTSLVTPDAIDASCDSAGRGPVLAGEGGTDRVRVVDHPEALFARPEQRPRPCLQSIRSIGENDASVCCWTT